MTMDIKYLPIEIWIIIMSLLGKTCNGSASLAKAKSVCKLFKNAVNGVTDLTDVRFRNINLRDRYQMFQNTEGLIYICAKAGNKSAQYLLAKIFLPTCSQLRNFGIPKDKLNKFLDYNPNRKSHQRHSYHEKFLAASFLSHFNHSQEPESSTSSPPSHRELVRVFLSNLTITDPIFMNKHLINYVSYFNRNATHGAYVDLFEHFIDTLSSIGLRRWGTSLVLYQGHFYVTDSKNVLIFPPPYLRGLGSEKVFIDWKYAGIVFKEVQRHAITAFDLFAKELH